MKNRMMIAFVFCCLLFSPKLKLSADNAIVFESYLAHLLQTHQLNDPNNDLSSIALMMLSDPAALSHDIIQLQPSWYADLGWSTENSLVNAGKIIRNNILARVREYRCAPQCKPPYPQRSRHRNHTCLEEPKPCIPNANFWIGGLGGHLQQDQLHQLPAFRSNDWGLISGCDFVLSNWLSLGIAGGYIHTDLKWDQLSGTNSIHNFFIGPYGVWTCDCWSIEASVLKGAQRYRSDRHAIFSFINRKAKNTHYGDSILCHLGVTRNFYWWDCSFAPYLTADYIYVHTNSIKEKGAGTLDLRVKRHNTQFFQGEIGASFSGSYRTDRVLIVPTVKGGFQTITPIADTKLRAHLRGQPGFFKVKTTTDPIYQGTFGLYLSIYTPCLPEFTVSYEGAWGNKRREYYYTAELDWCF